MTAYYNEIEPYAAAWLRNLIAEGLIAPGDVDERDIRDVRPDDLGGYTQCHFFAGIGVWSHALRLAGWPDDRPVWTGSCPCPPFSSAAPGQRCPECGSARNICHPRKTGHFICLACGCDRHADDRHLWPEFGRLIRECRPPVVFGEQVASEDGRLWLGAVQADLETMAYAAVGADLCAAGVGAPHIRQRLWFIAEYRMAYAESVGSGAGLRRHEQAERGRHIAPDGRSTNVLGDATVLRCEGRQSMPGPEARGVHAGTGSTGDMGDASGAGLPTCERQAVLGTGGRIEGRATVQSGGPHAEAGGLGHTQLLGCDAGEPGNERGQDGAGRQSWHVASGSSLDSGSGPTNGFWGTADWLFCRDGKWRPVEPGTFPLAHGAPARVGRLRAYGNAISPYPAAEIIGSYLDIERLRLTALSEMANDSDTQSGVFA